jgi:hypothetical protein
VAEKEIFRETFRTPSDCDKTGLNGNDLVKASKLSAKVIIRQFRMDINCICIILFCRITETGALFSRECMNRTERTLSLAFGEYIKSFVEEPHTGINGISRGTILNLTDAEASGNRKGILEISHTDLQEIMSDFSRLILPNHHDVQASDVDLKRLGALLYDKRTAAKFRRSANAGRCRSANHAVFGFGKRSHSVHRQDLKILPDFHLLMAEKTVIRFRFLPKSMMKVCRF